jgi:hypothetical protein
MTDTRRTRSYFKEPPLALTATKLFLPMHLFLVQPSYPQYYGEATRNPFWEFAMQDEYNSLLENHTWDLVPLPSEMKLFRCIWVYKTNNTMDGHISKYKVMLVAKGFQQVHDIDSDETFTPIKNMNSIHFAPAIAESKGWEFHQMVVKCWS